jgi:hypothetical protein
MFYAAQTDAREAARVGWVNSAFPIAPALKVHVDKLASLIALYDIESLRATEDSIAERAPTVKMLADDRLRFRTLGSRPFVAQDIRDILAKSGNQTLWWELNNNNNVVEGLYEYA